MVRDLRRIELATDIKSMRHHRQRGTLPVETHCRKTLRLLRQHHLRKGRHLITVKPVVLGNRLTGRNARRSFRYFGECVEIFL